MVNLPGNKKGIVYRIIPAQAQGKFDLTVMEFFNRLIPFDGQPASLETRLGTVSFDFGNLAKLTEISVRKIVKEYNRIYAEEMAFPPDNFQLS